MYSDASRMRARAQALTACAAEHPPADADHTARSPATHHSTSGHALGLDATNAASQTEPAQHYTDDRAGIRAPVEGVYQRLNIFGTPAGDCLLMTKHEELPALPIGWAWRLVGTDIEADPCHCPDIETQ